MTALAKTEPKEITLAPPTEFSAFGSITHFENAQRMAKALCSSNLVPESYRGEANIGNCVIALEISNRIGANILAVMQNLYIVYNRPAWSSQFLIATVNASRRFSALRYKTTGTKGQDSWGCIAWATDKTGERLESPEVTIAMAKSEGWYQKNGSKWKTMPELMLCYRSATLFCRLYAPEIGMGIRTDDEVLDIVEVAPVVTEQTKPNFGPVKVSVSAPTLEPVVESKPEEAPKEKKEYTLHPAPHSPARVKTPAENPVTAGTGGPVSEEPTSFEQVVDEEKPAAPIGIFPAMSKAEVTEAQVVRFYNKNKGSGAPAIEHMADIPAESLARLAAILVDEKSPMLKRIKEGK